MKILNQDITTVESGVIVHQVNCRGVMGSGVAKAIRDKYPQHFYDYYNHLRKLSKEELPPLGTVCWTHPSKDLSIAGVFGQLNFGIQRRVVYTDYDALEQGLHTVRTQAQDQAIYLPYGIGCGLANGDWSVVLPIIERVIPQAILCKIN